VVPVDLADVDLADEPMQRKAGACARLAFEERVVLLFGPVDDRRAASAFSS